MRRRVWLAVGGLVVAAAVAVWAAKARKAPQLAPDAPAGVALPEFEPMLSVRAATAPAEREKVRKSADGELGACDYPGGYVPCWCVGGTINTRGGCESAEEYLESVQMFGEPR